jgi:hypothetical protein
MLFFISFWLIKENGHLAISRPLLIVLSLLVVLSVYQGFTTVANLSVHTLYVAMFIMQVGLLAILLGSDITPPKPENFRWILRFTIGVSVAASLVHMLVGYGRPGWVWPINISIQELSLLILFLALLSISNVRRELPLLFPILILLFFRSSGKTALILFVSIPILVLLYKKSRIARIGLDNYIAIYFILFIGIAVVIATEFRLEVLTFYSSYRVDIIDARVDFWKRLSLIVEGMAHISISNHNLIFGTGFGYENYLSNINSHLDNTPQLFVLTLLVYGGVSFAALYFAMIIILKAEMIRALTADIHGRSIVVVSFAVFVTFFTTHEYFNNPFFFISMSMLILALKSRKAHLIQGPEINRSESRPFLVDRTSSPNIS